MEFLSVIVPDYLQDFCIGDTEMSTQKKNN